MDALERAQTFRGLQSVEELRIDDGSYVVTFDGQYVGHGAPPPDGATAAETTVGPATLEGR